MFTNGNHVLGDALKESADTIEQLRAQFAALREQEPVGWTTEDFDTDKSATTYDRAVAERWAAKGWPVEPLYAAPQPAIPEGWHGHKFKEVKKGRWKCDCGKEIVEQTQSIPVGLVQAIVESVAEFVEIQQGGLNSPAVIGAAIRGKNTYSSYFYEAMLAAQQEKNND